MTDDELRALLAAATPEIVWEVAERGFGDADLWFKPFAAWCQYDDSLTRGQLTVADAALIVAAVNELPRLLDRVAAAEANDRRYRWLRDHPSIVQERWEACWLEPKEIDAAIDAALQAQGADRE